MLPRSAVGYCPCDMQAAPARYVSVSELYTVDEVELLLDEIRELEPTSCRGEDVQDFEIAGSGCGGGAGGGGGGGRSPAGTELTERSWDSHAHYSARPALGALALAPLYCWAAYLRSAAGALSLALALAAGGACGAAYLAVGLRAAVPLPGRVRLLLLGALSSVLLQLALLAAHATRLAQLLPLDWSALGAGCALWSALSLLTGGALTLHAVLAAPEYKYTPQHMAHLLYSAAGLALAGGVLALALCLVMWRAWRAERTPSPYFAVPVAPPSAPFAPFPAPAVAHSHPHPYLEASTSRDHPL